MNGFSKVTSLPQFSPFHTYSRYTSRVAAEHPQMRVDSARAHFRAEESEPLALRPPRFAARPLRSVAEHDPSPSSLVLQKGLVVPERLNVYFKPSIIAARTSSDSSAALEECDRERAAIRDQSSRCHSHRDGGIRAGDLQTIPTQLSRVRDFRSRQKCVKASDLRPVKEGGYRPPQPTDPVPLQLRGTQAT